MSVVRDNKTPSNSSIICVTSLCASLENSILATCRRQFIGNSARSAKKPECICAQIERIFALAKAFSGTALLAKYCSLRYSHIASESQIVSPLSINTGTLSPASSASSSCSICGEYNQIIRSSNSSPKCVIKSHTLNDQEE